jgi:endonuclease III-like uncharacterized protein
MSKKIRETRSNPGEIWEDLIVSILAVNQYSLEKTYALLPLLRRAEVLDPEMLCNLQPEEVVERLKTNGVDRGSFMTLLFAMRLVSLGVALHSKGIASCVEVILSNDPEEIRNLLLPVNGIGPKVIGNFLLLRGIKD